MRRPIGRYQRSCEIEKLKKMKKMTSFAACLLPVPNGVLFVPKWRNLWFIIMVSCRNDDGSCTN